MMFKRTLRHVLTVTYAAILFTPLKVTAQISDTSIANPLQRSLDSLRIRYDVKGISAAAYIPGKGIWKGVTGISHQAVAIDNSMLLSIGSITKTFVAAEIFKLVEAGQLSLNDNVGSLLPSIANVDPSINVRQLLNHTSGMGDYLNGNWEQAMFTDLTKIWYYPDALADFCNPPTSAPGGPWNYANSNYSLLGMIIEAKKGDSLHRVLRQDFLQPLQLDHTHMEVFEHYTNTIPHNWVSPTLSPSMAVDSFTTPHQALWSSVEPAGGYFSDASDMAIWAHELYSGNVISSSSLNDMLTFTSVAGGYFNGYGLGAMRFTANGRTYYGHGGNYYGYASCMLYYPQSGISVAVLINQDCIATYEARSLMNNLINRITTGVSDTKEQVSFSVYPNPASNLLNVELPPSINPSHITVTDLLGRELIHIMSRPDGTLIDLRDISSGNYFVTVSNNNGKITKRFAVCR
jgi:CubicO group peptidase (beta-lactamase class C family)